MTESEAEELSPQPRITIIRKVVLPKVIVKQSNKQKLISPTKETYLSRSHTNTVKFGENLHAFKNNVPMYLFDLNRDDPKEGSSAI